MSSSQRSVSADSTRRSDSPVAAGARLTRFGLAGRVAAGSLPLVLCLLAGPVACEPSSANATPAAQTSPGSTAPPSRASPPKRLPEVEARTAAKPEDPVYELPFEARANPFAPPEPEQPVRSADGQTAHTFDVKLTGLMTGSDGMLAALIVDGRHEVVRVGASFTSEPDGGELRIVEIRPSEIVIEQNGRQRIVPLPRP